MKIGILTLPLHHNYGGILQAWALQRVLKNLGHDVYILSYSNLNIIHWTVFVKRAILKCLKRNYSTQIFYELKQKRRSKQIDRFINENINLKKISSLEKIESNDFEAIIVGSDQVWRKNYFEGMWKSKIQNAFLDFTKNWDIKRIAYAASFGIDEWQYSDTETELIKEALSRFHRISVREDSALDLIKNLDLNDITHVLDPTLLIDSEDYIKLLPKELKEKISNSSQTLVSYILDTNEEIENIVNSIASTKGLQRMELNNTNEAEMKTSVEKWIYNFANAELVITNSFHGCVFSIIFEKPLILMYNTKRGNARFDSLINMFKLMNNKVNNLMEFDPQNNYNIPNQTYRVLNSYKDLSKEFIISSLH